jgi:thiamine-monophosphate kinase
VKVSDLTERELVARIHARLPAPPEWMVVGVGDDAAVVENVRNRLEVLSVDAVVDGVHFDRAFTPPAAIGHRALAVNLSDLAAMGAVPRLALVSLALPRTFPLQDFDDMIASLTALAARCRLTIAGGNLTRIDGPLVLDITVVGTVKRRQVMTRDGARPGDELYVTGSIGAAAAGLQKLKSTVDRRLTTDDSLIERYLYPEPRLRLGALLGRNRAASACMDLSDGLGEAVHQLTEASGVGATIDAEALPIEPDARRWFEARGQDAMQEALAGGDDYELLLAVRPRLRRRLTAALRHGEVPLTRIGACTADRDIIVRHDGAARPMPRGFTHFR